MIVIYPDSALRDAVGLTTNLFVRVIGVRVIDPTVARVNYKIEIRIYFLLFAVVIIPRIVIKGFNDFESGR